MATRLYLTDVTADLVVSGFQVKKLSLTRDDGMVSVTRATSVSAPMPFNDTGDTLVWAFRTGTAYSTATGSNPAFHGWGLESNAMANLGLYVILIELYDNAGADIGNLAAAGTVSTEYGTSSAARDTGTAAFNAVSVAVGDWIFLRPAHNSSGGSAASGHTVTFRYGATSGGADGDSYLDLVETITEYVAPTFTPRRSPYPQLLAH